MFETHQKEIVIAEVFKKLAVAENQVRRGELLDGEETLRKLRKKYAELQPV